MVNKNYSHYDCSPVIRRLYDSRRWRKAAKFFLSQEENTLCKICLSFGRETLATIVDHIQPHKGDVNKFWSIDNWQGLCKHCHDSIKQSQEHGKLLHGANIDGMPIDSSHHWNKSK